MNTRMWQHPATQANLASARAAASRSSARRAASSPRARSVSAGWRSRRRSSPRAEAMLAQSRSLERQARARHGGRDARADRRRSVPRQPLLGPHGRRACRRGTSAGRPRDPARREHHRASADGVAVVATPTAADLEREALARADADVMLMAAAVADYRAATPIDGKRPKDGEPGRSSSSRPATSLKALGASRDAGQVLVAFGAEQGDGGLERKRAMLTTRTSISSSTTTWDAATSASTAPTTRSCSSRADGDRLVPKAPKDAIAAAILDEVERLLEGALIEADRTRAAPRRDGAADLADRVVAGLGTADARAAGHAAASAALPARRGARARRGRAGGRQDGARQGARAHARPALLARAVHARPAAGGRHGRQRLDQRDGALPLPSGPVFANVVLVDEINRASPKTQSALLEAMQETQVTVDGATLPLPRPFLVIATQNPVEYEGTYPLPEAQLDRFAVRMSIGYPPLAEEARMLTEQTGEPPLDHLDAGRGRATSWWPRSRRPATIYVEESVNRYVVALLRHTRGEPAPGARREPARGHRAAAARQGARRSSSDATSSTPEDIVRWPPSFSRTGCCSRRRLARQGSARKTSCATHSTGRPYRCEKEELRGDRARARRAARVLAFGSTPLAVVGLGLAAAGIFARLWARAADGSIEFERRLLAGERIEGDDLAVEIRAGHRRTPPGRRDPPPAAPRPARADREDATLAHRDRLRGSPARPPPTGAPRRGAHRSARPGADRAAGRRGIAASSFALGSRC